MSPPSPNASSPPSPWSGAIHVCVAIWNHHPCQIATQTRISGRCGPGWGSGGRSAGWRSSTWRPGTSSASTSWPTGSMPSPPISTGGDCSAGDRVAMLTPPGVDLVAAVYGVWRAGGVTVVADRGLGLRGLGAAVRGARPSWVIGPRRALRAARTLRWAPRATMVDIDELVAAGPGTLPDEPRADDVAAILFTSGATGPAKGVRYLHRQLAEQRDALARTYEITGDDRLVAAFAPFALYGPALGIPTCLPDCDVTKPGELTADTLEAACSRIGATLAFGSPAALANVVATATAARGHAGPGTPPRRVLRRGAGAGGDAPCDGPPRTSGHAAHPVRDDRGAADRRHRPRRHRRRESRRPGRRRLRRASGRRSGRADRRPLRVRSIRCRPASPGRSWSPHRGSPTAI